MKRKQTGSEEPRDEYAPEVMATDDSFTQLLARYRSQVYEQYHVLFTLGLSDENEENSTILL
jgi:hypothetical protein